MFLEYYLTQALVCSTIPNLSLYSIDLVKDHLVEASIFYSLFIFVWLTKLPSDHYMVVGSNSLHVGLTVDLYSYDLFCKMVIKSKTLAFCIGATVAQW